VKKPNKEDTIDEVNMNLFDKETENTQQEQMHVLYEVEEQQEEQQEEEPKEHQEEPKEHQEEPKEQQEEEPKEKKLTIDELKEILTEKIEKKNTALSYGYTIKQVYDYFKTDDVYSLLKKEQDIIDFIEDKYKTSISSRKSKLSGVLKCYTVLNLESKLLKDRIQHYKVLLKIKQDADKEKLTDKKTIDDGNEMIQQCKNEMDKLGEKVKNDIQLLNTWNITVQMYCVLKIYLDIGNLRGDEIIHMQILDTDTEEKINYINVKTNKIIIKNHKTESSTGTRIIVIENKKIMGVFKKGPGKYLITDTNGELFKTSSKFGEYFKSLYLYSPYDLRKALTSKIVRDCLTNGDTEKLEQLAYTQGHSIETMLKHYNTYNQENDNGLNLDTCLID